MSFLINPYRFGAACPADALAFIAAAGITDATQKQAICTLVSDLQTYGIWTKMKAIYPFVGGTASTHKWNLKDSRDLDAAFRLVFTGGWTHSSTGALPNGTNGYADTFLIPSTSLSLNSTHISTYLRTNTAGLKCDISVIQDNPTVLKDELNIYPNYLNNAYFRVYDNSGIAGGNPVTRGYFIANRNTSTQTTNRKNTTAYNVTINSQTQSSSKIIIGSGGSFSGTPQNFSDRQTAFVTIGDGLTSTELTNLYTAVQAYQTTLGRQV